MKRPPRGPRIFEWTRFCIAPEHREVRPRQRRASLNWPRASSNGASRRGSIPSLSRLIGDAMVIAMQLRFFVRPLGFPKRIGRDELVALRMSFNRETLATIHAARGSTSSVLAPAAAMPQRHEVYEAMPARGRDMTIRHSDAKQLAAKLHRRYDSKLQAVTLIGHCMTKALFAAKADAVVFWALVHAHYRGGPLCDETDQELSARPTVVEVRHDAGAEVTMVQRSPSWVAGVDQHDPGAARLHRWLPDRVVASALRTQNAAMSIGLYEISRRAPRVAAAYLRRGYAGGRRRGGGRRALHAALRPVGAAPVHRPGQRLPPNDRGRAGRDRHGPHRAVRARGARAGLRAVSSRRTSS